MKATLIIDDSGSMSTYEKKVIIRQLLSQFNFQIMNRSTIYTNYDIILWGSTIKYIPTMIDHFMIDQLPFENEGSHSGMLLSFLDASLQENKISNHIFFLTDGFFNEKFCKSFKSWQEARVNQLHISLICVGADSNIFRLKKFFNQSFVALSENFLTALKINESSNALKTPNTIEDLDQINTLSKQLHHLSLRNHNG
jgi:hypothetical protein